MSEAKQIANMSLLVTAANKIASDTMSFQLQRPDGGELPTFSAGSHIFVETPNELLRQYSLCNAPTELNRYVIAVKRDAAGRGGSKSMVDNLKVGDTLLASEPRNAFPLVQDAARYLFIAGGIGITPIRSMLLALSAAGSKPFKLYYCTRSSQETAFLGDWEKPEFKGKVVIHHDEGKPDRRLDLWPMLEKPDRTHLYCCGPNPLMQAVRDMAGHWPSSSVHFEDFGALKPKPRLDDRAFTVRLAKSGTKLTVPAQETLLQTLRNAGVRIASSCESGSCGSCQVGLLEGEADHRDFVLSENEQRDRIISCVSRACSPELVLDI
ncbi:ferredoxin reductase [Pollutimonas sp. H1-120]|uniref:PDR/VanB family oxidoreductase n=1 Tax=Pollutimonas sp. H1-120 TaxID=3148824 RepID=UPI003B52721A